jgi:hypothetical protein
MIGLLAVVALATAIGESPSPLPAMALPSGAHVGAPASPRTLQSSAGRRVTSAATTTMPGSAARHRGRLRPR